MKRLTCKKDYLCIMGKPSDITANLNKIGGMYDFTILCSAVKDEGIVMIIIERRQRPPCSEESQDSDHTEEKNLF